MQRWLPFNPGRIACLVLMPENTVATDFLVVQLKIFCQFFFFFTYRDTPGRYSPGTPQGTHGMQRGRSSPRVRHKCVAGCGNLWHNSASSWTRSPRMTNRHLQLSPPASSGAPRQVLWRKVKRQNEPVKVTKIWSDGEFKVSSREMKHAGCLSGSHTVHDFANGHISLSVLPEYIFATHVSHSSLLLSEWCAPPTHTHRSLTGETGNWFRGGLGQGGGRQWTVTPSLTSCRRANRSNGRPFQHVRPILQLLFPCIYSQVWVFLCATAVQDPVSLCMQKHRSQIIILLTFPHTFTEKPADFWILCTFSFLLAGAHLELC